MYVRLGGYSGVRGISGDLIRRLSSDPQLSRYFVDVTPAQRAELAKYAADYACKEAGEPCAPVRPNISLVRNAPSLTAEQKHAALSDLKQTFAARRVPSDIQSAISAIVR